MEKERILEALGDHPWRENILYLPQTGSTNADLKALARQGAPEGTCVFAGTQHAGRGRLGRSFLSPEGGVYFSVLLRPDRTAGQLLPLTAMAAVAAADAVRDASGVQTGIKWTNDLVIGTKKTAGILTEASFAPDGRADWVIIGAGINCARMQLPPELADTVTCLDAHAASPVCTEQLAAALVRRFLELSRALLQGNTAEWIGRFSGLCITPGHDVRLVCGDSERFAHAVGIDGNAALIVRLEDGTLETVSFGEVSVRGMYGYADGTSRS